MNAVDMTVLHWLPDASRWERIEGDDWMAFRALGVPFKALPGVAGGVHHFVVCVGDEKGIVNIIPHKYMTEPDGRIGADNFTGWTREERKDYRRLMRATEEAPGDRERLREIQRKGGLGFYPPRDALYPLVHALPAPPVSGSAAVKFLDELAVGSG